MKAKIPFITIGLDLGDKKHAICVLNVEGEIVEERTISNHREALRRLSLKYPGARVAMEVGTHSPWISRLLTDLGLEVLVANPRKVRVIYSNNRKSDQNDAHMLARIARFDPKLLHPIEHSCEQAQRDLLQVKMRDNLVKQRVNIMSSIRFTLKSIGVRVSSCNPDCFAKKCRASLAAENPELLTMCEPSIMAVEILTKSIKDLERKIEELCAQRYPATDLLRQITGVGAITALTYVLTVGDPSRFGEPRDVAAYLGLVPKRDQSGGLDKQLRISKAGDAYLRRLLVGAAQYVLGPFGPDCDLRRHGEALSERGGKAAKKKAVVAIARKLSVLLLVLWKNQSDYKPLRGTHLPQVA
jgi:transposase